MSNISDQYPCQQQEPLAQEVVVVRRRPAKQKHGTPKGAFIAFIAFMGAMTTGAGSVRERDVA